MRQNLENNDSYRADVVVRVYDKNNGSPKFAILIETKRKGAKISEEGASGQVKNYKETFEKLKNFGDDNIIPVTLTDIRTIFSDKDSSVVSLTWGELITAWESINDSIVKDYINYLLKINGNMKQYDKEVLSIPAANSYKNIKKSGIYCCPVSEKGPYKRRAESHPLYLACRQKGSIIEELFKIKDIIRIYRPIEEDIKNYLKKTYGEDFVNNLCQYWTPSEKEYSYVFIFDVNSTIQLPNRIKLKNGNAYSKDLTLQQVFSPQKDDIVEIVKKGDS